MSSNNGIGVTGVTFCLIVVAIIFIAAGLSVGFGVFRAKCVPCAPCAPCEKSDAPAPPAAAALRRNNARSAAEGGSVVAETGEVMVAPMMKFLGFMKYDDSAPWCISTRYAYQYIRDGVVQATSPFTDDIGSNSQSIPMFQIPMIPGMSVVILRAIVWNEQARILDTRIDSDGIFADYQNPCMVDINILTPPN